MYADRHARSFDPRSLGIAVAINGAVIAALLLASPVLTVVHRDHPLTTYPVPVPPPPDPLPPPPTERTAPQDPPISVPRPRVELPTPTPPVSTTDTLTLLPPLPPLPPTEVGPASVPEATPTPALVTVGPEIDPRHRADLQPAYPAEELRAEREGVVTVRVLVGVDGRVREIEQVSATSDAFFRATRTQALAKWRFRPATRGGVPVEAWRTMTIRFVIPR